MCPSISPGAPERFWVVACTVLDDETNHCYHEGTVKTNTSTRLLAASGPLTDAVDNLKSWAFPTGGRFPPFQVTCNISHRLYRPSTLPTPLAEREETTE